VEGERAKEGIVLSPPPGLGTSAASGFSSWMTRTPTTASAVPATFAIVRGTPSQTTSAMTVTIGTRFTETDTLVAERRARA